MIKPIETVYNGNRFRSRLEARWAVFFDELQIEYEYEPEGYTFADGICYLPDFYLPHHGYYVEVKGKNEHIQEDLIKIDNFVYEMKTAVLILSKIPYDEKAVGLYWFPISYYQATLERSVNHCHACFSCYNGRCGTIADDYSEGKTKYWAYPENSDDDRLYSAIQAKPDSMFHLHTEGDARLRDCTEWFDGINAALLKARGARFEHGEKGGKP